MIALGGKRLLLAAVAIAILAGPAYADRVDELVRVVDSERSEKARIAAVVGLGNLGDARGVPALVRSLSDPSPLVRGLAATALGHIGDDVAIPALQRLLVDDHDGVRRRAREAIHKIRQETTVEPEPVMTRARFVPKESARARALVVVNAMGNHMRTNRDLSDQLHDLVVRELERTGDVTLDPGAGGRLQRFVVDGSITRLSRRDNGPWVEVTCEVKLTVSNARGSILSIVSGGATVQTSRGSFRTSQEPELQLEALESAVRGAHRNLLSFLVKQVATN